MHIPVQASKEIGLSVDLFKMFLQSPLYPSAADSHCRDIR